MDGGVITSQFVCKQHKLKLDSLEKIIRKLI